MIRTTRKQREALFRIFRRDFPNWVTPFSRMSHVTNEVVRVPSIQYRRFRKSVQPALGDTCVMVQRWGMWIGIEQDGYCTRS
jgi:hypothetical protein